MNMIRFLTLFMFMAWCTPALIAQPPNDDCSGAIHLDIASSEATAIKVDGDTRNTVDEKEDSIPVCSGNFYRDAVWYSFTTPDTVLVNGFTLQIYCDELVDDIFGAGIALYLTCEGNVDNQPVSCISGLMGNRLYYNGFCPVLKPGETYYARVWSLGGSASNWQDGWGTFRIAAFVNPPPSIPENVLWDEGRFDGGLDGWTTEGSACGKDTFGNIVDGSNALWTWAINGLTMGGLMHGHQIESRSACDGAMVFDSEYLDNFGDYKTPGTGPCPVHQEGTLTSPTIDLSGFPVSSVSVLFYQKVFNFMSKYFIEYSTDDGQSWNSIEINQDIPLYQYGVTDQIPYDGHDRVQLPGAAGASELRIRFRMEGNYFYWIVDDVQIIETECNNLRITHDYSVTPNAIWQKDQLYDFPAAIQVENIGGCPQSGVIVELQIKDSGGNVVLFESKEIGDVPANAGPGLKRIVDCLDLSELPTGWYEFAYTVHSDSEDFDLVDNSQSFRFGIDENILAKEASMGFTSGIHPIDPDGSFDYSIGNHFFIPKGDGYEVVSVNVGIANADDLAPDVLGAEAELNVLLYEWEDLNNDGDCQMDDEVVTVGASTYVFQEGDKAYTVFEFPLYDPVNGGKVKLKDNTEYIVAIEYREPLIGPWKSAPLDILLSREYDYSFNRMLTGPVEAGGLEFCNPSYGGFLNVGFYDNVLRNDELPFYRIPVIRMKLHKITAIDDRPLANDNKIAIIPNPISDQLSINMDFEQNMDQVNIHISDIMGNTLLRETINNVQKTTWYRDVRELTNGPYLIVISTSLGVQTEKLLIIR